MSSTTDYDQLRAEAAAAVNRELDAIEDPFARRARAQEIHEQATMELAVLLPDRDQLLAAAALADGRVTKQLSDALGMSYSRAEKTARRILAEGLPRRSRWNTQTNLPAVRKKFADVLPIGPDTRQQAAEVARAYETAEARQAAAHARIEAAHEAVMTAGGRRKTGPINRPDFDTIRKEARDDVREEFAKLAAGPTDRLRRAAEEVNQAEEAMAALKPERDRALASLAFYTTARGVYFSAGLTRQGYQRVLETALGLPRGHKLPPRPEQPAAARAAGVPYLKDAAKELPQIAAAYEEARARRHAATEIRNAIVRALHAEPHQRAQSDIARAIDRDPSVVKRILDSAEESPEELREDV
jgi:DNA-binding MarR family transcriptional regulator